MHAPARTEPRHAHTGAAPARFDAEGFLADAEHWTPALAEHVAAEAGIGALTATHWQIIRFVRDRYLALGALPVMRLVCRAAGIDRQRGHELFGSCRTLWRIAGLPDPGEEAKAYMG